MDKTEMSWKRDPNLLGKYFEGDSWRMHHIADRATDGLPPLSRKDERLFGELLAGGRAWPRKMATTVLWLFGRRSGKSMSATERGLRKGMKGHKRLSPGESGIVGLVSWTRSHTRVLMNYFREFCAVPLISSQVDELLSEQIRLKTGVVIETQTCRYESGRGYSGIYWILEESSMWRSIGPNRDVEVVRSITPTLATTGGQIHAICTPYMRDSWVHKMYERYFGKNDDDFLVLCAPSITMNPTLNSDWIQRRIDIDPLSKSEWTAEFRQDLSNFISEEDVDSVVEPGVTVRPAQSDLTYLAFADLSGGKSDSSVLCIGHEDQEKRLWLDLIHERSGKHNPVTFCEEAAGLIYEYGCSEVYADRYAAQFQIDAWRQANVRFRPSEFDTSTIYRNFLPLVLSQRVHLLDSEVLKRQLISLERRVRAGGKDLITHPVGATDDVSNAAAGCLVHLSTKKTGIRELVWLGGNDLEGFDPFSYWR